MTVLPVNPGTPLSVPVSAVNTTKTVSRNNTPIDQTFKNELDRIIGKPKKLTFSRHASKRLEMRGISITPQGLERIESAVDRASVKGSRDAVVIAGSLTLVINVPSRTVVTVMDSENMNESIVTNIDSAVFA
ncbi:MAG: TIGR02530 family flagellar biosynthesis protein [bacterium]